MADKLLTRKYVHRGHTLLELLVAVFVVAILAAIAIPAFQSYAVTGRIDELKANILKLSTTQENYFASRSRYASSIEELNIFESIDSPAGMVFATGVILRESTGMSFWISGRKDVTNSGTTPVECWVFFSSILDPGTHDNFVRYYDQVKDMQTSGDCDQSFCPAYDTACN